MQLLFFIILHLVYLSLFLFFILFFLIFFNLFFFNFFKIYFFIFYTLNIYHFILGLFILFFLFLSLFFVFFPLHLFKKTIIQRLKKMYFIVTIVALFHSSAMLRISLTSYMFLLTHDIYYNLLAIISIFWFMVIFLTRCKKHVNNTYILILCVRKKNSWPATRRVE
jgi:hypothetical protein